MITSTPPQVDRAEIGPMRDEFANRLHAEWCGCDSWDGVNCEDYHEREFPEQADAVMPLVVEALGKRQGKFQELVAASLVFDYTAEGEAVGYADGDAEQAAALANVTEMHRLLGVRQERLSTGHGEIDRLRAENRELRGRISRAKDSLNEFMAGGEWAGLVAAQAALADGRGVSETPEATESGGER